MKNLVSSLRAASLLGLLFASAAGAAGAEPKENEHAKALLERDVATGDWGGLRTAAEEHGFTLGLHYTQEYLGVAHGGLRGGGEYNGLLELDLDFDLEKLVGWKGATIHASGYAAAGRSISALRVGDEANVSNINMRNTARLFELYLDQQFGDSFSVRLGMLANDSEFYSTDGEFFGSAGGLLFLNSDFGASPIMSFNVPEPIWPVSAPGISVTAKPTDSLTLRAAIYDGQPIPSDELDSRNGHGLDWRLSSSDGALIMAEAAYAINQPPKEEEPAADGGKTAGAPGDGKSSAKAIVPAPHGLGGIYKLGGFYHTGEFTKWSNGDSVHGDGGIYLTGCQMLWRENATDDQGLSAFGRFTYAPRDRNILTLDGEAGFNYRGLIPGRDADLCGLGFSCKRYSSEFSCSERRDGNPGRDHESELELTYRAAITPWCALQPDAQYVINPAGRHSNRNALVLGLRVAMDF